MPKKSSTKIISGTVIAAIAGALLAVIIYLVLNNISSDQTQSTVGSPVARAETPAYGACQALSEDHIQAVLQNGIETLSIGEPRGVVAPNGTTSEQCDYTFESPAASNNTLRVDIYEVSAEANNTADILDASWSLDIDAELPSYYKFETQDASIVHYLRVYNGPRIVQLTLVQPEEAQQFNLGDARFVLFQLAERIKFDLIEENVNRAADL